MRVPDGGKLKSGSYKEWRRAWEPDERPEGAKQAYILRNVENPDEIIAFGFFETQTSRCCATIPICARTAGAV